MKDIDNVKVEMVLATLIYIGLKDQPIFKGTRSNSINDEL